MVYCEQDITVRCTLSPSFFSRVFAHHLLAVTKNSSPASPISVEKSRNPIKFNTKNDAVLML